MANATGGGRTIWQAQDCDWWARERVVLLGEEFGPAGPAVANWLECQAKKQNDGGLVKAGYAALSRGAFLDGAEQAQQIVERAVEIGFLKDFEVKTRTFVATVAAFAADQPRGYAALQKEGARARSEAKSGDACPSENGHVQHREEKRREQQEKGTRAGAPEHAATGLHPEHAQVIAILATAPDLLVEPASVDAALRAHPAVDAVEAANLVVSWALSPGFVSKSATPLMHTAARKLSEEAARNAGVRQAAADREAAGGTARPAARPPRRSTQSGDRARRWAAKAAALREEPTP